VRIRHLRSLPQIVVLMSVLAACEPRNNGGGQSSSAAQPSSARQSTSAVQSSSATSAGSMAVLQQALDSCRAAGRAGSAAPGAQNGAADDPLLHGTIRTFPMFSLFVPDSARATVDTVRGSVSLAWPRCPDCRFTVHVQPDSGIDLEQRIARLVAEQRRIDSINRDPQAPDQEFDEIDGPPQPFTTSAGRGFLIDNDCGDCAAITLLWGRSGSIAELNLGGDDNVPELGRHLCEMTAIGKTFSWRD
jgi:hypothetical protein